MIIRASLFLLAVIIVLFSGYISPSYFFVQRDLHRFIIPMWDFGMRSMQSGHIPFWNPLIAAGTAHLANLQNQTFYPGMLIWTLLGGGIKYLNLYVIFHFWVAAVSFYIWMKALKATNVSALFGSIGFALSSFFFYMINNPPALSSSAYVPLVLASSVALFSKGSRLVFLGFVLSLCLMFLAGDPSVIFITMIIFGIYWVIKLTESQFITKRRRGFIVLAPIAGIVFFVGLCAFQILPFLERLQISDHSQMTYERCAFWSVPPHHWLGFLFPYAPYRFDMNFIGAGAGFQEFVLFYYLGCVVIFFALFSFIKLKETRVRLIWLLLMFSILLVSGGHTVFYKWFYSIVPFADSVRYPARFLFLVVLSVSTLSAIGLDAVSQHIDSRGRRRFFKFFFLGISVSGVLIALIMMHETITANFIKWKAPWITWRALALEAEEELVKFTHVLYSSTLHMLLIRCLFIISSVSLIVYLWGSKVIRRFAALMFIIAISIFDLWQDLYHAQPTIDVDKYYKVEGGVEKVLADDSIYRVSYSSSIRGGLETIRTDTTVNERIKQNKDLFGDDNTMVFGIQTLIGYEPMTNRDHAYYLAKLESQEPDLRTELLDIANVKYMALDIRKKEVPEHFDKIYSADVANVYENKNALPRVFLARGATAVSSRKEAIDNMLEEGRDPESVIYIESNQTLDQSGAAHEDDSVTISDYQNHEVIIEANTKESRWLFMSDSYDSNWNAEVNGERVDVYKANVIFRAILLPPGKSRVRFYYQPKMFYMGTVISFLTLAGLCVFLKKYRFC